LSKEQKTKTKSQTPKASETAGCTTKKRSSGSARGQKILHVRDFQDLYELADDIRKGRTGPLRFTRSLVTLSPFASDAESRHFERMRAIKARNERHLLRSVLADIVNWTAAKPFGMRGYLVTAEGKAASCEYLAEQLTVRTEDVKQSLPILEQIGFLERIPMNGQAEPEKQKRKTTNKKSKTGSTKTTKKRGKKSKQRNSGKSKNVVKHTSEHNTEALPESAGSSRTEPESVCPPSRKDKNKDKGKATSGLMAPGCKKNNNDNGKDVPQDKANGQAPGPPTNPPLPSLPQESDEGGRAHNVTRLPDSAAISRHGLAYGRRVFLALKLPWDIDSTEARREISSFGSKHDELCRKLSRLSPPVVDGLLNRGLIEAQKMSRRAANKNVGAVWNHAMSNIIAKHAAGSRSPP